MHVNTFFYLQMTKFKADEGRNMINSRLNKLFYDLISAMYYFKSNKVRVLAHALIKFIIFEFIKLRLYWHVQSNDD